MRKQSQGLDYFPFEIDFFSDKKIKILKARYGADGITIYLYLLCQIYREGYYTRVDEDFIFMLSDDLNMSSDKAQQVMTFLLERSMFDEQLFKSDAILTSAGIQERWQKAIKTRAQKTPIEVTEYWLLNQEQTAPFIKCTLYDNSSEKKADNSKKKDLNSENYSQSKVKESKVNNISLSARTRGKEKSEELKAFLSAHPKIEIDGYNGDISGIDFKRLSEAIEKSAVLQQVTSFEWLCRQWHRIRTGYYDNFNKPKPPAEKLKNERTYTSEELASVVSDIKDIEF